MLFGRGCHDGSPLRPMLEVKPRSMDALIESTIGSCDCMAAAENSGGLGSNRVFGLVIIIISLYA